MNELECPYTREANQMCNVLVREVVRAPCWANMQAAITAIIKVRSREKSHVQEWEHLNTPSHCGSLATEVEPVAK